MGFAWSLCVQGTFFLVQNMHAQQVVSTLQSQFRVNLGGSSDFVQLGRSIGDLEGLSLIRCSRLIYQIDPPATIVDTSFRHICRDSSVSLNGKAINIQLETINGSKFNLSTSTVNPSSFYLALWLTRILGWAIILLLLVFFRSRGLHKEKLHKIMLENANSLNKIMLENANALNRISAQVSHDIRSPLSALDLVLGNVGGLSEERRILIRSAITRIKDIANNLLEKNRNSEHELRASDESVHLISSLLDGLVSEKRAQFRGHLNIQIDYQPDAQSYGLFAKVHPVEFKRVLSNLINNSVEAFPYKVGAVTLMLRREVDDLVLEVVDNGKGIPADILPRLGQRGVSFGKERTKSGSGLGLYHARSTVESWSGKFEIESIEGRGTTLRMRLPCAETPKWFVENLELKANDKVVIVDDDSSIHQVWRGRLDALRVFEQNIDVLHFSSPADVRVWGSTQSSLERMVFLVDYEFLGEKQSGLDLIEDLNIAHSAILVTSRYEEPAILNRAEAMGVRLIPKGMAGLVPVAHQEFSPPGREYRRVARHH